MEVGKIVRGGPAWEEVTVMVKGLPPPQKRSAGMHDGEEHEEGAQQIRFYATVCARLLLVPRLLATHALGVGREKSPTGSLWGWKGGGASGST